MVELSRSIWNKRLNSAGLFGINSWTQHIQLYFTLCIFKIKNHLQFTRAKLHCKRTGTNKNSPRRTRKNQYDNTSVSDPGFFRIRIELFFLSPDPDHPKFRIRIYKKRPTVKRSVSTNRKFVYFIFSTHNNVLFGQVPSKPNKKTSFRSHWLVNERIRIRVFKVWIRIGEKIRIHPDPEHWIPVILSMILFAHV